MIDSLLKHIRQFPTQLFLVFIGALLFIPFLGNVHLFDWDEISFAESAREMLLTHNFTTVQMNFATNFEMPPLFIWLQALSMHYFGVNEFAARLPNAICGIATMVVVFNVGRYIFKSQFGMLWSLLFACSILPQVYFKSGIIDPVFNLLVFLSLFFMYKLSVQNDFEHYKTSKRNRRWNLLLSALCISLATLTKGPIAIVLIMLTACTYFVVNRGKLKIEISEMILWWIIVFLVIATWLTVEYRQFGVNFISDYIHYQVQSYTAEKRGPLVYHFIVLLLGVFPASALIFDSLRKNVHDDTEQMLFKRWMLYLLLVVLVVFTVIKTKIVHYSSLSYFPITFLAAYYLNYFLDGKMNWTWKQTVPLFSICLIIVSALTGGIFLIQHQDLVVYYIKDEFTKECMKAPVYWSNNDIRFGIGYLIVIIAAMILIQMKHRRWGVYLMLISTALFINTVMIFIVPRVERYTQGAMVDFIESAYYSAPPSVIETIGVKSYAPYFYNRKPLPTEEDSIKPHFLITRVDKVKEVNTADSTYTELYRQNGWVFYQKR